MVALPSFATLSANDGLDDQVVPRWLMVPLAGSKTVRLRSAPGMTVASLSPAIVKVTEQKANPAFKGDRILKLDGLLAGTAVITVTNAKGVTLSRLECAVKIRKTVRVAFNFVRDSAGHATQRKTTSVDGWVATMNRIFQPQANVEIKKHSVRNVVVPKDLGKVVRFSSHLPGVAPAQHEWADVLAQGDATADFNIFFVWEYEQDATPFKDDTDAGTMAGGCIFEDKAGKELGETLAHETGHFLGAPDTYSAGHVKELMYGITDKRGKWLRKGGRQSDQPLVRHPAASHDANTA